MKIKPNFRERLIEEGVERLSDLELMQILLGSGTATVSLAQISKNVLAIIELKKTALDVALLKKIHGMGTAKICTILSAFELSRRLVFCEKKKIIYPSDLMYLLCNYADRQQEYFICLYLNGAHELISRKVISVGIINQALVHPREVFAYAIEMRATGIILAHNHPSSNLLPSTEDEQVTNRIVEAGSILGIQVIDHVIFSADAYYSFSEHKKI